MSERFMFCKTERLAYTILQEVSTKYGAFVFPHLRIKEVANKDWIDEEAFDYALKGHIDFTIAVDFRPILAVELDGRFHQNLKARERDKKKDSVCAMLGIPLVRLDYGHMRAELLQPILAEVAEAWLSDTSVLAGPHEGQLNASAEQVWVCKQYCAQLLEVSNVDEAELRMVTNDLDDGYAETFVEMCFGTQKFVLAGGRAKVPATPRYCVRRLSEQIALSQAGWYLRTKNGTARDAICDEWIELQSTKLCPACASPPPPATTRADLTRLVLQNQQWHRR